MQDFEVQALLEQNFNNYKNDWEQTRFIAYVQACMFSKKVKSPKDVLSFAWEQPDERKDYTPEELKEIRDRILAGIQGNN